MEDSLKILFVVNPISGASDKQNWESQIREHFSPLPHTIDFFQLSGGNDADAIKHKIDDIHPDRVVAVGGDGTVSIVARMMLGSAAALGIVPAGSANGMARELQLPQALPEALDLIVNGEVRNADVVQVNDHICLHLSDIGLNAKLIKYFEEGNTRGMMGYAKVAFKTLWRKTFMSVRIKANGQEISKIALMVAIANASKYGTGAVINPQGDLYDGLFEVVVIRRLALSEIFKMLFRPSPFNPSKIQVIQTKEVSISATRKIHFQVDGEYLGKVDRINASILAGQLRLVVPPTAG